MHSKNYLYCCYLQWLRPPPTSTAATITAGVTAATSAIRGADTTLITDQIRIELPSSMRRRSSLRIVFRLTSLRTLAQGVAAGSRWNLEVRVLSLASESRV